MKKCPVNKMKPCIKDECMWWVEMTIKNIQNGQVELSNNCAISKLPELLVEQLRNTNGIQSAVESSRNDNVKRQDKMLDMFDSARRRIGNSDR